MNDSPRIFFANVNLYVVANKRNCCEEKRSALFTHNT